MNSQPFPEDFYGQRIADIKENLKKLYKQKNLIGWLRLVTLILAILGVYYTWNLNITSIIISVLAGVSLFFFLVSKDTDNREEINNLEILQQLNKKELQHALRKFDDCYDGKNLEPEHHAYASDLDLFGKSSLYQYLNRCYAERARLLLANRFLAPMNKTEILEQQKAVEELSQKPFWRQQLQAYGVGQEITIATEQKVAKWLALEETSFNKRFIKQLLYIYPFITSGSLYLSLAGYISASFFLLLLLIFFGISISFSKKITPVYNLLSKIVSEISVLYNELNWFEKETFESKLLTGLQQKIKHRSIRASDNILALRNILNRFDTRLNVIAFAILNTFCLWDLWQ